MPAATMLARSHGRWSLWLAGVALALCPALPVQGQSSVVTVSAVILSKSNCKITSGKTASITFLPIDPSSALTFTRSAPMTLSCGGSASTATFSITAGSGLHPDGSGNRQLLNGTDGSFMTYSMSISPPSGSVGKNTPLTFSVDATLAPSDFASATAGSYSDTVSITLSP